MRPRKRPKYSDEWIDLELPNRNSDIQTPASLKIDLRYAKLQIYDRWTYDRFVRLATFLNLTAGELASLACIPHRSLPVFERRNRLKIGLCKNYGSAFLLTLIEAHVCREWTHDIIANPFPDLSSEPGTTQPTNAFSGNPEK